MESGETLEQAIRREVEEETGCRLVGLERHGHAPGEYDHEPTLNFLFTGRIEGEPRAGDDSAELRWWPLSRVPPIAWPHEAAFVHGLAGRRRATGSTARR